MLNDGPRARRARACARARPRPSRMPPEGHRPGQGSRPARGVLPRVAVTGMRSGHRPAPRRRGTLQAPPVRPSEPRKSRTRRPFAGSCIFLVPDEPVRPSELRKSRTRRPHARLSAGSCISSAPDESVRPSESRNPPTRRPHADLSAGSCISSARTSRFGRASPGKSGRPRFDSRRLAARACMGRGGPASARAWRSCEVSPGHRRLSRRAGAACPRRAPGRA